MHKEMSRAKGAFAPDRFNGMSRRRSYRIAIVATLAFASTSIAHVAHAAIPDSERAVLLDLYTSTSGSGWRDQASWNGPAGTECTWFGITCDAAQTHVVKVELGENGLTGPLPALDGLTELEVFDVDSECCVTPDFGLPNQLTGPIPVLPARLQQFSATLAGLTGSIPALSAYTELQSFDVTGNRLSGPLPSLAGLENLESFVVAGNQLTGSIPDLTGLSSLRRLDVSSNPITGTIPSLSGLGQLQSFSAALTLLTGSIPTLAGLGNLQTFDVSRTPLDGTIGSLSGDVSLVEFHADYCQLTGSIPALTEAVNLQVLTLYGNRLTGSIPTLTGLTRLVSLNLSANQLTGSIPSLAGLSSLSDFLVIDNQLTGSIPSLDGLGSLQSIDFSDNALTGPIPELADRGLVSLQGFGAARNKLTGSVPALTGLTTLFAFAVEDNELSGTLPPFDGLDNLQGFDASGNVLTGTIPELSGVPFLGYFNVNDNELTGSIPSFDAVLGLSEFHASNNRLTGPIPSLSRLAYLTILDVGFNRLTGPLPSGEPNAEFVTSGFSTLCPNQLTPSPSDAWDSAVGYAPWYQGCSESYVNLNQFGLTGSWYDVDNAGKGLLIDAMPDFSADGVGLIFGGWFNYRCVALFGCADTPTPLQAQQWFSVQGETQASSPYATLGVYESRGGNFDAPPAVGAVHVGTVVIAFEDCTHGIVRYHFTNGRYFDRTIPLTRLTSNTSCTSSGQSSATPDASLLSGAWYDPATSGQGILFDLSTTQDVLFAAWYTYAWQGSLGDPREGQRWYTLQADIAPGATTYQAVSIFQSTGGVFDAPGSIATVPVGSADISFQTCTEMTVSYTFASGENAGRTGTLHLNRLGPAPAGCVL